MLVFTCGSVRWGCESGSQSEHREDGWTCLWRRRLGCRCNAELVRAVTRGCGRGEAAQTQASPCASGRSSSAREAEAEAHGSARLLEISAAKEGWLLRRRRVDCGGEAAKTRASPSNMADPGPMGKPNQRQEDGRVCGQSGLVPAATLSLFELRRAVDCRSDVARQVPLAFARGCGWLGRPSGSQ